MSKVLLSHRLSFVARLGVFAKFKKESEEEKQYKLRFRIDVGLDWGIDGLIRYCALQ